MSLPFYTNIDLNKNQLLNAILQVLPSAPSNPSEGQFYYNSASKLFFYYDGNRWVSGEEYTLPVATSSTLGGVKQGTGTTIANDGTLAVKLSNSLTGTDTSTALNLAGAKALKDLIDTINNTLNGLGTAATKNTGTSSGNVPVLDSNGKLNTSVIPSIAITDVYEAASESAMLALSAQQGDICVRTDTNTIYILKQTPASTLANWVTIDIPIKVNSVNGKTGVVVLSGADIQATAVINGTSKTDTINAMLAALNTYIGSVESVAEDAATDAVSALSTANSIKNNLKSDYYVGNVGNGSATSIAVTHNLGTKDVFVELYENSSGQTVYADVTRTSTSVVTLSFASAPTSNQFRVLIRRAQSLPNE